MDVQQMTNQTHNNKNTIQTYTDHTPHRKFEEQTAIHLSFCVCLCTTPTRVCCQMCKSLIVVNMFLSLLIQLMVIDFVHQLARLSQLLFESTLLHGFPPEVPEMEQFVKRWTERTCLGQLQTPNDSRWLRNRTSKYQVPVKQKSMITNRPPWNRELNHGCIFWFFMAKQMKSFISSRLWKCVWITCFNSLMAMGVALARVRDCFRGSLGSLIWNNPEKVGDEMIFRQSL